MKVKCLIKTAFAYAIAAMAGGVFYREFTKFSGFSGRTNLAFVHTHLFMLGMFFFLIAAVLEKVFEFSKDRRYKVFFITYNTGVIITAIMLLIRGIPQVVNADLTKGMSAAISGIAGIGHIFLAIGVVIFFLMLKKTAE